MTQYQKDNVIGKNCKFLQPNIIPENENIQYILMKNALEHDLPISVIITNKKKDDTLFQNLLSLIPIKNKNYIFVVRVQIELTLNEINITDI